MITKTQTRSKERVQQKTTTPVRIVSAAKAASVLTITFDQPVILKGVPEYTVTGASVTALSAVLTSATTLALTFSGAVTAATVVNIPFEDPGIRSAVGGFVANSSFPVT
jgi:hypothetical protein